MSVGTRMIKEPNWPIIAFFAITTAGALIGAPVYFHYFGISLSEILLALFFVITTGLAITVGYHRLFAHTTYRTNGFVRFLILFFGAAAFEQSALTWSSGHRDHHRYVDTDLDPYSIKKGFWYAHIGWMTLWKQEPDYNNVKDLMRDKVLMNQHYQYVAWAFGSGVFFPVLLGAMMGHALGALVFAVCVRLTFVYHATFCINSVCHTFGEATYDIHATARDHWFAAVLTNGEGYHNFHHRFPNDYRNGILWYHWDPSKWVIALLGKMGMAWDLKQASDFKILQAKLNAENSLLMERLNAGKNGHKPPLKIFENINLKYASLMEHLSAWEASAKEYQVHALKRASDKSNELRLAAHEKMEQARTNFQIHHRQWTGLIRNLELANIPA